MKIFPKQKTDAEYVEGVRKLIARSKWFGLFHACGFVFFLGMFWWIWMMIYSETSFFSTLPASVEHGGFIGVMLGAFAGMQLVLAGQNAMWAAQHFGDHRTERLLLRFHDALQNVQQAACSEPRDSAAGPNQASVAWGR